MRQKTTTKTDTQIKHQQSTTTTKINKNNETKTTKQQNKQTI